MPRWRSALVDASWPVLEITRQLVADDGGSVIWLNAPHGEDNPDYPYDYSNLAKSTKRDIDSFEE